MDSHVLVQRLLTGRQFIRLGTDCSFPAQIRNSASPSVYGHVSAVPITVVKFGVKRLFTTSNGGTILGYFTACLPTKACPPVSGLVSLSRSSQSEILNAAL